MIKSTQIQMINQTLFFSSDDILSGDFQFKSKTIFFFILNFLIVYRMFYQFVAQNAGMIKKYYVKQYRQ